MSYNWNLDAAHSEVSFKVKHMMIANVTGTIGKFNVEVQDADENLHSAKFVFTANMDSIQTGDSQRDGHLKSGDFFEIEKFPTLRFESTALSSNELKGILTIKDISKEITLDVEDGGTGKDPWGNTRRGFTVSGKINRKDWGLTWNAALETGGILVSDDVRINCEVQFVRG
jgi:polyisoprenoid-binding protein YceI